jgi:hypothetical protein
MSHYYQHAAAKIREGALVMQGIRQSAQPSRLFSTSTTHQSASTAKRKTQAIRMSQLPQPR